MLPIHMLITPVIEIDPDGKSARGMWQTLGCNSFPTRHGLQAVWQQGKYDNAFVKEGSLWRFSRFRWLCHFRTPPGAPHDPYDPTRPMDFGPEPPEPMI